MTKDNFLELQVEVSKSDKTLKEVLQENGISYSTYHYWHKKYSEAESLPIAPISIKNPQSSTAAPCTLEEVSPSGVTLAFPNGLRAHFGRGSENLLVEIFSKSLGNVLS